MAKKDLVTLTNPKDQKMSLELKVPAANMIRGLAKLYKTSPVEIIRYFFNVGRAVLQNDQEGGEAYLNDKSGKYHKILPPR
jgi:hypothetical protein